ncbi:uncharacterized protein NPIL_12271, partial [Nephila pilipes]
MKTCMRKMLYSLLVFLALCAAASWTPIGARVIHKRAAFYIANDTMCIVDGDVYRNGDPVPTDDECERCTCRPPGFSCVLRDCDAKPGCKAVRRAGECCPEYVCGCVHNNRVYEDGEIIKDLQNACYTCRCHGSSISCTFADCLFRGDCPPEYVPGECCPRYDHCPPLSTTSSTIFTTESTTRSPVVQQQEQFFINATTQHLEKFTAKDTTVTIFDVSPSSITTASISDVSTPSPVTVKFSLTDGPISSISDLDITTLSSLLPLKPATYTETTKYVFSQENKPTTQSSFSEIFDDHSSHKTEEVVPVTSTTSIVTEDKKDSLMTTIPESSSEFITSDSLLHTDKHNTEDNVVKIESTSFDDSQDHAFNFEGTTEEIKTSTKDDISDLSNAFSSTTSYETTEIFEGEETQNTQITVSSKASSEVFNVSEADSHTEIKEQDHSTTEQFNETHKFHGISQLYSTTEAISRETESSTESIYNVSNISDTTESTTTTASYTTEYTDYAHLSSKAPVVTEINELYSPNTEIFDGEETIVTEKHNESSVVSDISESHMLTHSSHHIPETTSTEQSDESSTVSSVTDLHSNPEASDVITQKDDALDTLQTIESHVSEEIQDHGEYFSTEKSNETEESSFSVLSNSSTETTNENEEFSSQFNEISEFSNVLENITTKVEETKLTESWKETPLHTDSTYSQTTNKQEIRSTLESLEYSTESGMSFTESGIFMDNTSLIFETSTQNKNDVYVESSSTSTEYDSSTSIVTISAAETINKSSISDTPHLSEISVTENEVTTHGSLNDTQDENISQDSEASNESLAATILGTENFSTYDSKISNEPLVTTILGTEKFSTYDSEISNEPLITTILGTENFSTHNSDSSLEKVGTGYSEILSAFNPTTPIRESEEISVFDDSLKETITEDSKISNKYYTTTEEFKESTSYSSND